MYTCRVVCVPVRVVQGIINSPEEVNSNGIHCARSALLTQVSSFVFPNAA
jgi:hypothetical protein